MEWRFFSDIFHIVAGKVLSKSVKTVEIPYNKKLDFSEKKDYLRLVQVGLNMLGDKTDYKLSIEENDFETPKQLYYLLLDSINTNKNKIVGHKVTEVEKNIKNLLLHTDINVLYIVRDPRDQVISSMEKFGYNIYTAVIKWRNGIENILDINSDRLFILKFEDLIYKNKNLKKDLEDFLNVSLTYNIKKAKQHNKVFVSNSSFNDVKKTFDKNAVFRWKKKNEFRFKYIYLMTSDLIKILNYDTMNYSEDDLNKKNKINNLIESNYDFKRKLKNNNSKINKLLNKKISNYKI